VEFLQGVIEWLGENAGLTTGLVALSIVLLVASLWVGHYYLTAIPPDYFMRKHKPLESWRRTRPALWWSLVIGKNLVGALFITAGLIMFVTPGQGVLTLLMGLALMDFPGKQRLERAIVRRPTVLKLVNGLRSRANKPPLEFE
jgi:hypothetical protein